MTNRPPSPHSSMRRVVAAGAAAGLAATLLSSVAHADQAIPEPADTDAYEVTELGPAIFTANVRSAEYGVDADGTDVVYALSNGEPATFTVLDEATGEQLYAQMLEGYDLGGFLVQADDGQVYFTARTGSYAGLFQFDPETEELTELDVDLQDQRVLYEGSLDDDGVLYFGTYPDAMVMAYDTVAEELHSYGSITDEAGYVFSLGLVGDEVWAGTGPVPHLFRLDPETGETTEVHPPDHVMENTDWFIGIEHREDHVFVRLSPRGDFDMAVYHLEEDRWLDDVIEGTFDTAVSEPVDGNVYFLVDDVLTGFDLETETTFSTGFEETEVYEEMAEAVGTYALTVTDVPDGTHPGPTAKGINTDGQLWAYHLESEQAELVDADVLGSPAGAHSMGVGPDGAVYMGAYLSSGAMSRVDPDTQEIEYMNGPKQGDAIITHGDQLVVSEYPGAGVNVGPVADGWDWSQAEEVLHLDRGAPYYQDRIFAIASMEDSIAVGSVPDYGQVGGALTILDPHTGDYDFHRDVVEGQSIVSLAYQDGILYGGTSIHGGIDSSPVAESAEFFLWDVANAELITSDVIDEDVSIINQVIVGSDGLVWALTDTGLVFTVDLETGEVIDRIETGLVTGNNWGRTTSLFEHEGWVYGNAGSSLFRINPDDHAVETIVDGGVRESAVDGTGQIYFAGSTNVYALNATGPVCDDTITGVRNGPLTLDADTTCIVDATLRGPLTVAEGASVYIENSSLNGPFNASGAGEVVLEDSTFNGPVNIHGSTGTVVLQGIEISGPLSCTENTQPPRGGQNSVSGPASGQCTELVE